jgi:hypothetical protein
MQTFRATLFWLGVVVATLSLTSLVQHLTEFSLDAFTAQVVDHYRKVRDAAKWALADWWLELWWPSLSIPGWVFDVVNFWLLCAFAEYRGHVAFVEITLGVRISDYPEQRKYMIPQWRLWYSLVAGPIALLVSVFSDLHHVVEMVFVRPAYEPELEILVQKARVTTIVKLITKVIPFVATALFFAWGAIQL